jgi:hypothetical protein
MTIRLVLKAGSSARTLALQSIPTPYHDQIQVEVAVKTDQIPKKADFVLHCGKAAPTTKAEFFAAQRGTHLTCLPEAMTWFQQKLDSRLSEQESVTIVDALLHKITKRF